MHSPRALCGALVFKSSRDFVDIVWYQESVISAAFFSQVILSSASVLLFIDERIAAPGSFATVFRPIMDLPRIPCGIRIIKYRR